MAKKLHLLCNAHIDPVWQWEWEEGAAETLSTFRIAADFCEQYDKFVFCHNEALLYRWIEEYDMPLFERIQKLVTMGKWNIMGGWHLQPDCNLPSGEFFVRQIQEGRKYFLEKFGKVPHVAINFDPFGHTRGLVQIMKKTGYDGYIFMRPSKYHMDLESDEFTWRGYDGSEVTAVRLQDGYASAKGKAAEKIKDFIDRCEEDDFFICLWGIGNHGGGPSKKDLDDIVALQNQVAKDGVELIHSTADDYIDIVNKYHKKRLPVVEHSLVPWAVGCYTSQVRIKQKYRQAENVFNLAEIMASHASLSGLMKYPEKEFAEALYDILTVQFHDSIPGSSIQAVEEMALRMLDHALEILSRIKARAFFALAAGQKKADSDKIPFFAYNPYPYPINADLACEFMLWDQNWNEEFLSPVLYDKNGELVPSQCEKEASTIPLEWRKRVVFNATLEPMTLNRFDCAFDTIDKKPSAVCDENDTHYIFDENGLRVEISKSTGLIDAYCKNGENYLKSGAFGLDVYNDDHDPWGMMVNSFKDKIGSFRIASPDETKEICCLDNPIPAVHLIEGGDVRTVIEAVFVYNKSSAIVKYYLSKKDGFRVDVRVNWNEKQRMIKMAVLSSFGADTCIGEQAYGREILKDNLDENVSQRYITLTGSGKGICAINNGVYGSSFDKNEGVLNITLLRSPSYCAHPIFDGKVHRKVMPQDRYMPYIEQGERDFSFRFELGTEKEILDTAARSARHFNMPPMVYSFYPTGVGEKPVSPMEITESEIVECTTLKMADNGDGYIIRLFNPTAEKQSCKVTFMGKSVNVNFGIYEIKTLRATKEKIFETDLLEGLLD
ncbi:MAG: alpha-mannosidase [Clostridia bacterium]|nr:alpha-mannosidase [Clostridia bacterium]